MGIAEKGCNVVDWIHLTLGQVVSSCENSKAITSFQSMTCSMKLVNIQWNRDLSFLKGTEKTNDECGKMINPNMWCFQVLRSPNLFKRNYSPQEAENAVISQRNHPLDVHIFHNAHATIAWPQQTLL